MWVVRPVGTSDLSALHELAAGLGAGMTTLPPDGAVLAGKIESSEASFAGRAERADAQYLLVLEDEDSGAVLGTAAVYASRPCAVNTEPLLLSTQTLETFRVCWAPAAAQGDTVSLPDGVRRTLGIEAGTTIRAASAAATPAQPGMAKPALACEG